MLLPDRRGISRASFLMVLAAGVIVQGWMLWVWLLR